MKKITALFLALLMTAMCASCGSPIEEKTDVVPQLSQVKSICELAVMDCYYHNVAKFREEDAEGILWWKKDKHFWIEYSGIVRFGIDVSLVDINVNGSEITITIPEAEVQSCKVDSSSLTKESYIIDVDSADIDAEDEIYALNEAQKKLEETASNDKALLAEAQQRAQSLLTDYVKNLNSAAGKDYSIRWVYVNGNGKKLGTSDSEPLSETEGTEEK